MQHLSLVAGLNPTSHDTSWRQPCSTCLRSSRTEELHLWSPRPGCQGLV